MAKQSMLARTQEWLPLASDDDLIHVFAEIYVEFQIRGLPLRPFMADPEPIKKKWWRAA